MCNSSISCELNVAYASDANPTPPSLWVYRIQRQFLLLPDLPRCYIPRQVLRYHSPDTVPPIVMHSLTLFTIDGSCRKARAIFVKGPSVTNVMLLAKRLIVSIIVVTPWAFG